MTLKELAEWVKDEYAILSKWESQKFPGDQNRRSRAYLEGRLRTLAEIELMARNGTRPRHSPEPKPPQKRKKKEIPK
jgi:hypothetical protein